MHQAFRDVLDFHRRCTPHLIGATPAVPSYDHEELRWRLVREEYEELHRAVLNDDLPEIADGIADLIFVAVGLGITYGIDIRPVWTAVAEANLAKAGGPVVNGKLQKPPGWTHPDIAAILARQEPIR